MIQARVVPTSVLAIRVVPGSCCRWEHHYRQPPGTPSSATLRSELAERTLMQTRCVPQFVLAEAPCSRRMRAARRCWTSVLARRVMRPVIGSQKMNRSCPLRVASSHAMLQSGLARGSVIRARVVPPHQCLQEVWFREVVAVGCSTTDSRPGHHRVQHRGQCWREFADASALCAAISACKPVVYPGGRRRRESRCEQQPVTPSGLLRRSACVCAPVRAEGAVGAVFVPCRLVRRLRGQPFPAALLCINVCTAGMEIYWKLGFVKGFVGPMGVD